MSSKLYFRFFCLFFFSSLGVQAQQIVLENILILRDEFGVPYIYSKTDAEAAYALAWVQSEDNFYDVQESLLISKGLLSQVKGKEGALMDALSFIINARATVDAQYEQGLSEEFKALVEAYAAGINRFAETHSEEIRHAKLFPVSAKDIMSTYVLNTVFLSNVHFDLIRIFENDLDAILPVETPSGSNGIAISPTRSADGKTYLLANSHQPLEGFAAWYEVQINTEEGWHFHGATFAAGITPFIGTNEFLGWTHTVNYDDFSDVYELEMHPSKKNYYKLDQEWLPLKERKLKLKVKIAGIPIPISRTFYESEHGPVIKNKLGYYALRFPANKVLGAAEQWYHMNKAQNINEFSEALRMQQIVSLNIMYADYEGNIMYVANGLFPYRNPKYDWQKIVPGNTREAIWDAEFMPLDSLILLTNPSSGYVFNMNNSSYDCTAPENNPKPEDYNVTMGYQSGLTARSIRLHDLIDTIEKISYADLKRIKYDSHMHFPLHTRAIGNLDLIRNLNASKYPDIADVIEVLGKWNGSVEADNLQAAIISLAIQEIIAYMKEKHIGELNNELPEEVFADGLRFAKKHLLKHFGSLEIPLGDLQKHVRGDKELGIWGVPEAITQMYTKPYKDGKYKTVLGDSYILFATYNEGGLEKMESINCFGSSNRPESPHYNDQMEMFVNKQLREVSLDKDSNLKKATKAYRPW
ncbi:MAG: penicillin acylase family protein [Chitinophagales bacterium]|nr:penicillin acylase family protein [Chitinophagales bacterium]